MSNEEKDTFIKCQDCKKAANGRGRIAKLSIAPGVDIFLVSLRSVVDETTHEAMSIFLSKVLPELAETLLNEQVARRALQ